MIPINPSARTMRRYVHNILRTYERATEDQIQRGATWYLTANQLASMLADGDTTKGAGVIAALSANKRWSENQKLATAAFSGQVRGHTGATLVKVARILAGAAPEDVLPMHMKTGHFYACIANPEHTDAVVIDRHAADVAINKVCGDDERGLGSKGRYNALADAYRTAAKRLGILPNQVQATVWVVWVESVIIGQGNRGKVYY